MKSSSVHDRWLNFLLAVFVFLLPWQARWIVDAPLVNGGAWEYGTTSIYVTEVLLWVILLVGYAAMLKRGVLRRRFVVNVGNPKIWVVGSVFGLVLLATLSLAWAIDVGVTQRAWFRLVEGSALFFLLVTTPFRLLTLARAGAAAAALQGVLALNQFFVQAVPASTWLGTAAQSADVLGTSVVELSDGRWLRAYGTLPHPNVLAGYLAMGLMLAAIWYVARRSHLDRVAALVCALFASAGLVVSFSRTGMVAVLIGLLVLAAATHRDKETHWLLARFLFFVVLVMAVVGGLLAPLVQARATSVGRLEQRSMSERQSLDAQGRALIQAHGLLGVGIGNATVASQRAWPGQPGWAYQPPHDVWLVVAVELGVLGMFALIGLVLSLGWHLGSQRNWVGLGLVAALIVLARFDHYLWTLYPGILLWWVVLGLAVRAATVPPLSKGR